ncbi:unnamed protein product [Parnassius apollo]|uniref:Tektin n=1 Tax=Parnassius apollo TaxID=110799 RepID=A0A8S3Y5E2_PARAO|nr:unnamed protein product [Parnassius apollo]
MFSQDALYGFTESLSWLRSMSDKLNAEVVEQVNNTQELVMKNNFMKESNEYLLKKCLEESRISDVASWRWVLDDLAKRLEDSIDALKHESDALRVVVHRIDYEINAATSYVAKPGALSPMIDHVEEAIMQELAFLREEKRNFERMIIQVNKQIAGLEKTKKRIVDDAFNKYQAMSVDEACCHNDHKFVNIENNKTKKPKKAARVQLSITAQAYGTRVDSALRRRLHSNVIKLQDLDWQREEAIRDFQSMENELTTTEKSVLDTMDRQKTVQDRLAERTLRPFGEHTSDGVNRQLRNELGKLRQFIKELRTNIQIIISLQNHLRGAIAHIDCNAEDIAQVVKIDQERLRARLGDETGTNVNATNTASLPQPRHDSSERRMEYPLDAIKEEDENDLF